MVPNNKRFRAPFYAKGKYCFVRSRQHFRPLGIVHAPTSWPCEFPFYPDVQAMLYCRKDSRADRLILSTFLESVKFSPRLNCVSFLSRSCSPFGAGSSFSIHTTCALTCGITHTHSLSISLFLSLVFANLHTTRRCRMCSRVACREYSRRRLQQPLYLPISRVSR